jgi:DNA polymerase sigma
MDPSLLSMAELHNYYSSLDSRIIPFIGIIRLWAKLSGYSSHGLAGQLSPYIITQMALNYMQSIGFIPQIEMLKKGKQKLHLGQGKKGYNLIIYYRLLGGA